ncbi:MAG: LysM peptidoglycan-binding domain-containing protein [Spirochaetales bacterium]|jgi:membrane-bound lytic murein transglycosylase D
MKHSMAYVSIRRRLILAAAFLLFFGSLGCAYGHDPDALPGAAIESSLDEAMPVIEPVPIAAAEPAPLPADPVSDQIPPPEQASAEVVPPPEPAPADAAPSEPAPAQIAQPEPAAIVPDTILSSGILVDGLQYDISMPWGHEEFENLRAAYLTSGGKKWLQAVMERSLPYLGYIEEKVEEYGLPKELAYLPVIESEYSPFAVSRSGATGIWQFMRNSISGYDMSISDWTDDRKDFMKSTDAALRKLQENYKVLGDWLLAIAAYNAGLGALSRAVNTPDGKEIDFWNLYESKKLSREPLSYVPKFLAVASILSYPELHGLPAEWGEKHSWEALETSRQVDLSVLAERSGISLDMLKQGNAELKYSITPPNSSYLVKVPADKANTVRGILNDTSSPLFKYTIYKVKSGDTLGAIARRYATPLSIILQANKGIKADKIKIGQTIIIPHLSGTSATPKASIGESLSFSDYYTVKKGDTLWDISLLFDVQPDLLADRNGIGVNSVLRIGQKLKVPVR